MPIQNLTIGLHMNREQKIKDYIDLIALGDELYDSDLRRVMRKTTKSEWRGGALVTTYEQEIIEFS